MPRNPGSHAVQHLAELLQVGFACCIVDGRRTRCQYGGHYDVGRTSHRRFVQQHIGSVQVVPLDHEKFIGYVEIEFGTQLLESEEVGVQPAASDLVAARFGDVPHAETGQHRADEHDRAAQFGAALAIVVAAQVVEIDVAGAERVGVFCGVFHFDAHAAQQLDELQYVENLRYVANRDPFGGQQGCTRDLQRLVFGALRGDAAVEPVASFDLEYSHILIVIISF